MATCKQTAAELIQDVFSPCIAVLCSSDVEVICAKNNLTFVEMVQPFCRLNTEVSMRDPSNIPSSVRNLRIIMKDMNSQPPPVNLGKKMMHDTVASNAPTSSDGILCNSVVVDNYQLKYNATTPWFEAYREVFFQVFSPMEHEFIHHYLSCIFVVSSSHQDPLSQLNDLCQLQAQHQLQNSRQSSKWFFSYIFKYYVLVHDTSDENLAKAEAVYQSMKCSFGSSVCHFLQINSSNESHGKTINSSEDTNGASNLPDPWSQFLPKYYPQQDSTALNDVNSESNEPAHVEGPVREFDNNMSLSNKGIIINHPLLNSSDDLVNNLNIDSNERPRASSFSLNYWGKSNNRNKKHGLCLTLSDMDRIRVFVQEFCLQGLIPFVEKQIRILSDQVTNRKSIHRTIVGVTKKFFAGNKPGVQGPAASVNSVVYGQDAPELQVRKLGDLAFMFQMYEIAYQAYHTAKRDFSGDSAWLYFAGAAEMAALSVFMQGNTVLHEYPARYIETAISTYLLTCKFTELAMRATFLSTECLKAKGLYRDAALQFMRMPSEMDLPCALFLEQAAHCFINCRPPKVRKYAFYIVLAGHRYSKAGQRKHAQRSYKLAEQVFKNLSWKYANNHINLMIGRFSSYLNQLDTACAAFKELLIAQTIQPPADQANHLKEYLLSLKQYLSQQSSHDNFQLPLLPIPIIDCQATKVLLSEDNVVTDDGAVVVFGRGFEQADTNNAIWAKLEEMLIIKLHKNLPPLHNTQLYCLTQKTNNSSKPIAVVNEIITVEVVMRNPLNVAFAIDNVFLLWTFTRQPDSDNGKEPVSFSNELEFSKAMMLKSVVQTQVLPQLQFEAQTTVKIHLTLKPVHTGTLLIRGLAYSLLSPVSQNEDSPSETPTAKSSNTLSMQGKQLIELTGPRLNKTVTERIQKIYAPDHRLNLQIISPMPKLQVKYKSFPNVLYCGEIRSTTVEFLNCGQQNLQRLFMASATPAVFVLGNHSKVESTSHTYKEVPCSRHASPFAEEWMKCEWETEVTSADGTSLCLTPGQHMSLPLWIRGPDVPGEHVVQLLFYYEVEHPHPKLRHRIVQHSVVLNTKSSLVVEASVMLSHRAEDNSHSHCSHRASPLSLSLEVGNISEELVEISLMQISCISPKWFLTSSDDCLPNSFPVILSTESLLLTFKAVGFDVESKDFDSSRPMMVFSRIPLGRFEVDSNSSPCSEFTKKSTISLANLLSTETHKSYQSKPLKTQPYIQLLLTLLWKAKIQNENESIIVSGQHHVIIEDTTSTNEMCRLPSREPISLEPSETASAVPMAAGLVRCSISHPFHVQHNFKKKRIISVPVEFVVQSTCNVVLQITIDNTDCSLSPSLLYNFEEGQSPTTQPFTWVNGSKREIPLPPSKEARIQLCASFCRPGTYNLGCLNVSVRCSTEAAVNYIMSAYPIIISACDSPLH